MSDNGRQLLPQNVKPFHYSLHLATDLEQGIFKGSVNVELNIIEASHKIVVNSLELNISLATFDAVEPYKIEYDEDNQTAGLYWHNTWSAGQTKILHMVFTGRLNENMAGFYRGTYQAKDGKTTHMGLTQFQATDCRRAFPCWDEPALKATFDITTTSGKQFTHLSNMPVKEEKLNGNFKTTSFETTPFMSTYLLAWAIGDFNHVQSDDFRCPVRVYTIPGSEHQGHYAANLGAKTLIFFEKLFGIQYPLSKMDMLALPNCAVDAMENWGLITSREICILLDERTVSASARERIADTVQHELAHQWFGNLVTMEFWDGLWLNEGFATWMAMFAGNQFYPDWKLWESYIAGELQSGLRLDSLRNSHPIEIPVKRADEINQIFDNISYSKGCSVLAMLAKYLGENVFINGVSMYLQKYLYANTKNDDLWEMLSIVSGKDVVELMQIWTKKVGLPVISVVEHEDSLIVTQNRFLSSGDVTEEEDQTLFVVPLAIIVAGESDPVTHDVILKSRQMSVPMSKDNLRVYKLNADQFGFYRTCYPPERLIKLGQQAVEYPEIFSVQDRTGLVSDSGALAAAGYSKTSRFLNLVQQWKYEDAYVFEDAFYLANNALQTFQRDLTSSKANDIGWTFLREGNHVLARYKALLFGNAGEAGDPNVVAASFQMFSNFLNGDKSAIPPDIRKHVFSIVVKFGSEAEYNSILNIYLHPQSEEEKLTALESLGLVRDLRLIRKSLQFALSKQVKSQDIFLILLGLQHHPSGVLEMWSWAKRNWDDIVRTAPSVLTALSHIVMLVTSGLTTSTQIQEVEEFFKHTSTKRFDKALSQSFDIMKSKQKWVQRHSDDVQEFLLEHGYLKTDID